MLLSCLILKIEDFCNSLGSKKSKSVAKCSRSTHSNMNYKDTKMVEASAPEHTEIDFNVNRVSFILNIHFNKSFIKRLHSTAKAPFSKLINN